MTPKKRPVVLCVDDEPRVLESLQLTLRRQYEAHTALGGTQALELLPSLGDLAVVLSDMRMPEMDGAALLSEMRTRSPNTVRMLLTGETDLVRAAEAVNQGQVFRFLLKPCPPDQLLRAFAAAIEQHRLITAERVLLEQTLKGFVRALADVLALANPLAFGRAVRLQRYAKSVAERLKLPDTWAIEVAALVSQIGWVTISLDVAQRYELGSPLSEHERELIDGVPVRAQELLQNIPRLEAVQEILEALAAPERRPNTKGPPIPAGAHIVRLVIAFDRLETRGLSPEAAIDDLYRQQTSVDPAVLTAFSELHQTVQPGWVLQDLPLAALRVGMILNRDVKLRSGVLLLARGVEISQSLMSRLRQFPPGQVLEPIKVKVQTVQLTES